MRRRKNVHDQAFSRFKYSYAIIFLFKSKVLKLGKLFLSSHFGDCALNTTGTDNTSLTLAQATPAAITAAPLVESPLPSNGTEKELLLTTHNYDSSNIEIKPNANANANANASANTNVNTDVKSNTSTNTSINANATDTMKSVVDKDAEKTKLPSSAANGGAFVMRNDTINSPNSYHNPPPICTYCNVEHQV
jgi:hypothetical protein